MAKEKQLDLINRGELLDAEYLVSMDGALGYVVDSEIVRRAKSVNAVEVVHGRWEDGHCTSCNYLAEVQNIGFNCTGGTKVNYKHTNYCPNCGAKMDGGNEDGC